MRCGRNFHPLLSASRLDVGLPADQMGNSEVGHSIMGSRRVIYQHYTYIGKGINDGSFFDNPVLQAALDKAVQTDKQVHLLGLL